MQIVEEDVGKILRQTIEKYEQDAGKTLQPAHIERLLINVYAYRELLVRQGINEAFRQTFPQTATGLALDLCGETFGCHRLQNKPARTILRFSVQGEHSNIVIAKGTVAMIDGLEFATLDDVIITSLISFIDVEAECQQVGTVGNGWQAGRIKQLKNGIAGVSVVNIDVSSGGLVQEDDDSYRKRILAAPEAFSSCGSIAAYDYHTRAVSQAIVDVNVATPKGGLVRISILSKNGVPDTRLLNDVKKHLSAERLRPLCDTVEVVSPIKRDYQIQARLTLLDGHREDIVRNQALTSLQTYLSDKANRLGVDIVPSAIISSLRVEGVYDVELLSPSKQVINENEWANCTNINLIINTERVNG